jgi:hypothetical protein
LDEFVEEVRECVVRCRIDSERDACRLDAPAPGARYDARDGHLVRAQGGAQSLGLTAAFVDEIALRGAVADLETRGVADAGRGQP